VRFLSSPDEEYGTLLPFIRDGFNSGERAYQPTWTKVQ
jgi:hypothetical protein